MSPGEPLWQPRGGGDCGDLIRSIDWSKTAVGSIDAWPLSLRIMVQTLLGTLQPTLLFWGPELVQFYNDAFGPSLGVGKHPSAMGQRAQEFWGETWVIVGPQIAGVMTSQIPVWHEDALVPIHRNGRIEEVYWTYSYSPAFDDNGNAAGTLVVCTETTAGILANRRLKLSAAVADRAGLSGEHGEVLANAFGRFVDSPADLPFAAAFDADRHTLAHEFGLDTAGRADIGALVAELAQDAQPDRVTLPRALVSGPWPEPVTEIFVAPLATGGVLVFGLSSRLPFDDSYREFLLQLVESVETANERVAAIAGRLSVEHERRELLMQAPVAAALMTGPEHTFELANPRYVQMVGREVLGKAYLEAFPEVRGTPLVEIIDRVYLHGEPFSTAEMLVPIDQDGSGSPQNVYFKFNLQPIRNDGGEVYGMMAIAVDITATVEAREAQNEAHSTLLRSHDERTALVGKLKEANAAKDEFLAMLGHELRNPLAPIVTALELIKMDSGEELSREHALIARQVDHLVRLVDDLLDVARITRGKVELKKESMVIGAVVARAIEMAESVLEKRRHRLTVDVADGLAWWGDPTRLAQVVSNLLTNAARYTEPGGDVRVTADRSATGEIVIAVSDTGHGIAAEMIANIFDMFVQGRRKVDRAEGGLGLGLTLVKNLVELHGGRVSAKSAGLGHGSTFEIRLPPSEIEAAAPEALATSTQAKRVLVVDDNVDAAEMLGALLRNLGHKVEVAHDGLSALEAVERLLPEVAVLDIGLPVMDGYELAERISLLDLETPCRLVALTGYGQREDRDRSEAAGFVAHLVKPVNFDELARAIA